MVDLSGDRRAMSPLVATFLLISFALAVGLLFVGFGSAQANLEARCTIDIGLEFAEIEGVEQVCFDSVKKNIQFTVENGANIDIEELLVNVIGEKRAESFQLEDAKIPKGGVYLSPLGYNDEVSGSIRQFKVVPTVIPFDEPMLCTEQAVVAESIPEC